MSARATPVVEERVYDACRRRLADAKSPTVRLPVRSFASELGVNTRQAKRGLRGLSETGVIETRFLGPSEGIVVIARGEEAA